MENNHRLDLSIGFEELIKWITLTTTNTVSWAESVAAWSSFATTVSTLGLLVAAVWVGFTAISAMRVSKAANNAAAEASEQMKLDSIAQTRPYMYTDTVPSLARRRHFDPRITNVGKTAARNLHIQSDNWPEKIDDVAEHVKILFETERTLSPGCSTRTYWRLEGNFSDRTTKAGMPKEGTIELFYGSDDPAAPQYQEQCEVLTFRSGLFPVTEDGPEPDNLYSTERSFYLLGQAIARSIGDLSR